MYFVFMCLTMVYLMSLIFLDSKEMSGSNVDNMKLVIFKPHLRTPKEETQKTV